MSTEHEDTTARQDTLGGRAALLLREGCPAARAATLPRSCRCRLRQHRLVLDVRRHALSSRPHQQRPQLPGAELNELVHAARVLALAERRVNEAVQSARMAGASWGQVGDALGTSRQAAQQRFAGTVLSSSTAADRP